MNNEDIFMSTPIYSVSPLDTEIQTFSSDVSALKDNLKDLIQSQQTAISIFTLTTQAGLQSYKAGSLASVVRDIVMGYVFLGDMTAEIQKRLEVDEQTAGAIGDRLLSDIFAEHWDELQVWNVEQYRKNQGKPNAMQQNIINNIQKHDEIESQAAPKAQPKAPIATVTSFRMSPTRAIISAGYNPKASRLMPFQTSAGRQAEIIGNRELQKPNDVRQPAQNSKIIDLRKK